MAKTESEIVELMNKRIDAAFAEEKDRKTARNRARVNLHSLTVGSGDRPGVRTLEQLAKYLADNPRDYSLQALRDQLAPAAPKPEWKPRSF
jgi:predicted kinase